MTDMKECVVCKSSDFFPSPELNKELLRCKKCNLIFYKDIENISPETIYNSNYFIDGRYYDYLADRPVFERNFRNRIEVLRKFSKGSKLLEIGSAYGFFLEAAKQYYDISGVDIAEEGVKFSRDVLGIENVKCADYLDLDYGSGAFDVICLFDTIEHLNRPHLYVEKAARELKPGGLLSLTTGDIGSPMAKLQKSRWRLINIPTHLFYFSFANLELLLKNYGLKVIYRGYPGYYRSLGAMLYLTLFKNNSAITKSRFFKYIARIPIYLNLYDIMFVIAKKER